MRVLETFDRDEIAQLLRGDDYFWLDLVEPADHDVVALGELLGLHELAVEDSRKFGQRPKIDEYSDHVLLVFYSATKGPEGVELSENHVYVGADWLVTIRRTPCSELDGLRRELRARGLPSEHYIVYRVLDTLTDTFFPPLEAIDQRIDAIEEELLERTDDEQRRELFTLKREVVAIRRAVVPQRDIFARAIDAVTAIPGFEAGTRDYFRDVYDHLIRISDSADSYRDVLAAATDLYVSQISNRLNAVMKQLTVVSTIFLPLTFVTGFFGQNFGWLVEHADTRTAFLVYGIGGLVVPAIALMAWFRRSGIV